MRALVFALAAALAVPSVVWAQSDDEGEGTYSTYSSDEAQVQVEWQGYEEPAAAEPAGESSEQRLFDVFWTELSKYGRWEEDPTYSWVWYPADEGFRPYSDGWWVYTTEGWTYESAAPYAWAVYHYGRWAWLSGGWAWLPGYEWSPGWVTMRVSGNYIGWAPLGPGGYVWDYWPVGWGFAYSPWLFIAIDDFGAHRHHRHHFCDHRRGEEAYGQTNPLPQGRGRGRGGAPSFNEIPNTHQVSPAPVVEGDRPVSQGANQGSAVVVYRPRPNPDNLGLPTNSGQAPADRQRFAPRTSRDLGAGRPGPAVTPPRPGAPAYPSAPQAPTGSRFEPQTSRAPAAPGARQERRSEPRVVQPPGAPHAQPPSPRQVAPVAPQQPRAPAVAPPPQQPVRPAAPAHPSSPPDHDRRGRN